MIESVSQAQIDAAAAYERLFVPALFQEWAPRIAAAVRLQPRQRVLDVACGTGVLTREAGAHVSPGGRAAGLDANPAMLVVASRLAPTVEWQLGTAEHLPYQEYSFDAVVSQFGLMFLTDRRQALREMWRVLVPSGRLAVAVWDALDNTPAYAAEMGLLERLAGRHAAEALRAPFVLGRRVGLAELATGAGLLSVEITTSRGTGRFPSIRTMVEADLRGWLPVMGVHLGEEVIARILAEAEETLAPFRMLNGEVRFDLSAHILTAHKS